MKQDTLYHIHASATHIQDGSKELLVAVERLITKDFSTTSEKLTMHDFVTAIEKIGNEWLAIKGQIVKDVTGT